jgi:hypothetical protein
MGTTTTANRRSSYAQSHFYSNDYNVNGQNNHDLFQPDYELPKTMNRSSVIGTAAANNNNITTTTASDTAPVTATPATAADYFACKNKRAEAEKGLNEQKRQSQIVNDYALYLRKQYDHCDAERRAIERDYIDMKLRNITLLEENKTLKERLNSSKLEVLQKDDAISELKVQAEDYLKTIEELKKMIALSESCRSNTARALAKWRKEKGLNTTNTTNNTANNTSNKGGQEGDETTTPQI